MTIDTTSCRLRRTARLCRWLPLAASARVARWLYPDSVARAENAAFETRSSLGHALLAFGQFDCIATTFAACGCFDWQNVAIAKTLCGAGDTIVEIGANLGTETLLYALIVGTAGRVTAFEPLPANEAALRRNVQRNALRQVEIRSEAVAAQHGTARFQPPADRTNTGTGTLIGTRATSGKTMEVNTVSLDELYAAGRLREPRLVVIDAEGAESDVLAGSQELLRAVRPHLILEVAQPCLERRGLTAQDIFTQLADLGYSSWAIHRWSIRPPDLRARQSNWVCIPASANVRATLRRLRRAVWFAGWLPPIRGLNPAVVGRGHPTAPRPRVGAPANAL